MMRVFGLSATCRLPLKPPSMRRSPRGIGLKRVGSEDRRGSGEEALRSAKFRPPVEIAVRE